MNETYNSNNYQQPFASEVSTNAGSKSDNQYRFIINIIYILGFFILVIPIALFIYLMFLSSYRAFLFSSLLLKIVGGVSITITFLLILFLSISYSRRFSRKPEKTFGSYFYIGFVVVLIAVLFILVGFVLYNLFLMGLNKPAEIKTNNNLERTNVDSDIPNGDIQETKYPVKEETTYVEYDKKVHKDLNLYTEEGEDIPKDEGNERVIRFDDLIETISKHPIFKDLPRSGSIKISFFTIVDNKEIIDQTFIFTTDPEINPDLELYINSDHIDPIIDDLCLGIQEARADGAFRYKLNRNQLIMFSKYSKLMEYKDCFTG